MVSVEIDQTIAILLHGAFKRDGAARRRSR
jgi:hypothetical protein